MDQWHIYYANNNTEAHYLTAANGCDSVVILDLTIKAAPTVDLGNDVAICQGDSMLLDAGSGHTNYLWNTGKLPKPFMPTLLGRIM